MHRDSPLANGHSDTTKWVRVPVTKQLRDVIALIQADPDGKTSGSDLPPEIIEQIILNTPPSMAASLWRSRVAVVRAVLSDRITMRNWIAAYPDVPIGQWLTLLQWAVLSAPEMAATLVAGLTAGTITRDKLAMTALFTGRKEAALFVNGGREFADVPVARDENGLFLTEAATNRRLAIDSRVPVELSPVLDSLLPRLTRIKFQSAIITALPLQWPPLLREFRAAETTMPAVALVGCANLEEVRLLFCECPSLLLSGVPALRRLNITGTPNLGAMDRPLPAGLTQLWMGETELKSIDGNALPDGLRKLHLHENELSELPSNLPDSIILLDVSTNQLTRLPDRLPSSLVNLDVSLNRLDSLPQNLPASLQTLDAYNNNISALPKTLPDSLKKINLDNNPLSSLPSELPRDLVSMSLNGTMITDAQLEAARKTRRS